MGLCVCVFLFLIFLFYKVELSDNRFGCSSIVLFTLLSEIGRKANMIFENTHAEITVLSGRNT